jgi:peroxiredoxin
MKRGLMNIKIKIILVFMILLICIPVTLCLGQYKTTAPSIPETIPAPDFSLMDLQGKKFTLKSQLGKPVVIFFGTTWCPSCRAEIPAVKAMYETYAERGLVIVYIDIQEPAEKVARFVRSYSLPYQVLLDKDGSVAGNYDVIGVPMLFLINKEGNVIAAGHRSSHLPINKLFPSSK